MYRRYCLLVAPHRRNNSQLSREAAAVDQPTPASVAASAIDNVAMPPPPPPEDDEEWERRYRLLPGPTGLATSSGLLDEEAYLTLSQSVLVGQRKTVSRRGPAGTPLLLLAGPPGSGKSYLVTCLAAELPDHLVLSVPAACLLPRRRERAGGADDAGASVRRLFEFARGGGSAGRPCVLAIENLEVLLENEAADKPCRTASLVAEALTACLQACRRDARKLAAVVVTSRRPWLAKEPLSGLFQHRLALSRPDARRRRQVLANMASRADAFAPFSESLNAEDFGSTGGQLLDAVVAGTEGMSPGDLVSVLHHAANYPLKQMVYQRIRLPQSIEQCRLNPQDIHRVLAECFASVSHQEWQLYADWAAVEAS